MYITRDFGAATNHWKNQVVLCSLCFAAFASYLLRWGVWWGCRTVACLPIHLHTLLFLLFRCLSLSFTLYSLFLCSMPERKQKGVKSVIPTSPIFHLRTPSTYIYIPTPQKEYIPPSPFVSLWISSLYIYPSPLHSTSTTDASCSLDRMPLWTEKNIYYPLIRAASGYHARLVHAYVLAPDGESRLVASRTSCKCLFALQKNRCGINGLSPTSRKYTPIISSQYIAPVRSWLAWSWEFCLC